MIRAWWTEQQLNCQKGKGGRPSLECDNLGISTCAFGTKYCTLKEKSNASRRTGKNGRDQPDRTSAGRKNTYRSCGGRVCMKAHEDTYRTENLRGGPFGKPPPNARREIKGRTPIALRLHYLNGDRYWLLREG